MTRFSTSRRIFLAAFLLLYLTVAQFHLFQHWEQDPADGSVAQTGRVEGPSADRIFLPGAGWAHVSTGNQLEAPCPGGFPAHGKAHHSCHCSMLQFTVQPPVENHVLLTANEIVFLPADQVFTQYYPHGVKPPPRIS